MVLKVIIILWTFTYPTYRITLNKISPVEADVRFHACLSEFTLPLCGQPMKPLIYRVINQLIRVKAGVQHRDVCWKE